MTPRQIVDLLTIAEKANQWPRLHSLRDSALRELETAYLSTIETIIPVMIVNDDNKEKLNDHSTREVGARRSREA
jgi:hypothetical protein